eukprot:CAMPEP_0183473902 /NCGR_PEP_ID=MMETSP0370-20130417/162165_1 /TAXON_ID=268820 /ORGANISM="Peridinium aciculiferum, Strain PAER-2" /LENGTH=41 /DNA_ID= /DNA_START= /DNA_END= /DNA_ORIENTATION=
MVHGHPARARHADARRARVDAPVAVFEEVLLEDLQALLQSR